jgi:uncharacterized protein
MDFDWNPDKARHNAAKHRVTFEEASTAFGDPLSLTIDDPDHSFGEERFLLLGETFSGRLVVVAHAVEGETVRIISARLAQRHERKTYEDG